ncbi:MAG: DUF1343 domain-containing protein, partial [Clostridia bacterium]|nr:DUF1343 domain-containing protein [Clostridia bacterium]
PTFSKHAGELCRGVQFHIHDRAVYQPFAVGLRLFCALRELHPEETTTRSFLCNLLGTDDVLQPGFDPEAYIAEQIEKVAAWQEMTKAYYLY